MNPLKRLASQTAVYGLSSIIGRFLNYLLVPLYTYTFAPADYGVVAEFYAYMGLLAVLLVFGLETGYFRFRSDGEFAAPVVLATALRFLILANGIFLLSAVVFQQPVADLLRHADHPEYIWWVAAILAMDSVGAAAFARLRAENRALRFAAVKLIEIGLNIGLNLFFILLCRQAWEADPSSALGRLWNPAIGIGYVFLANLAASALKLLLLTPQLWDALTGFDRRLFKRMLRYSLPMVIIGMAGIVNEMLDRAALKYLLPFDNATNMAQLGIYSACYKLSILMTLFIQAFRYAGEPFFFAYARQHDAKQLYALVLNWFVIFCVFIFLLVTLYLDLFQYFVGAAYREGLSVVPVLLLANLLLGVYVNLSIWYKLTDRTLLGAWVALTGAGITISMLWLLVPTFGYQGAAWAHLACYSSMVALSYGLGRRYYPVPYDLKRIFGYIALGLVLFGASHWLIEELGWHALLAGTLCMAAYLAVVALLDGRGLLAGSA
ncbi:MAG TPA: polysaccharide biosynthesis protein [Chromatiaceae bacterium]|nr:MAG: polysaccharide biosynthesis protein [Thiohalocapsa sp. PB-PSB1]QQO57266.1 MAG: polysaccharide biosynthesis protein [Thiohalocapsa sp. PB-PSB1]HBG95868.1 polysaccharide biosynthesis protein [Chromatiaceae bacterium]HCS90937.1 polysaccharide biosynthesis protein [Chromatiaceae bacterium]